MQKIVFLFLFEKEEMTEEMELYKKMIDAQYEYFSHIEKSWSEKFANETKDMMWDLTHWAYSIFFPSKSENEKKDENLITDETLGSIYRKLSLLCHPDKCTDERASKTFAIISELYENRDFDSLKKIEANIPLTGSDGFAGSARREVNTENVHNYVENFHKTKFIERCMCMIWYAWYADKEKGKLLREILVDKKVGLERLKDFEKKETERLKRENEILEKENAYMREEIKKSKERLERMKTETN